MPAPAPTHPSTTRPPAVADLTILDTIARGGQGTVHLAHQRAHDRTVALKVLDVRRVDDAAIRRFERERIALGRISDHPFIVSMIDSGYLDNGDPFLVLEYAPGGSLADRLEEGPLDLDDATSLAVGLASAIARAHDAGIVHRDIKPGNVVRSAYGHWMLTDFGIASVSDSDATDTVQASYAHAAPEVFDGAEVSARSDIYSLASLVATALTDVEPFATRCDEAVASTMRRIGTEPYPRLTGVGVPVGLADILGAALSKDPACRPASAQAFGAAVNAWRRQHGLAAVPMRTGTDDISPDTVVVLHSENLGPTATSEERLASPRRRHRRSAKRTRKRAKATGAGRRRALSFAGVTMAIAAAIGLVAGDVDVSSLLSDPPTAMVAGDLVIESDAEELDGTGETAEDAAMLEAAGDGDGDGDGNGGRGRNGPGDGYGDGDRPPRDGGGRNGGDGNGGDGDGDGDGRGDNGPN
ncbi:MAG: serine/threonine-protein kinase [Ilumatobacter sp.]